MPSQPTPPPASPLHSSHAWSGIVSMDEASGLSKSSGDDSIVRYGDEIRLFAKSHYLLDKPNVEGGYVGYYFRSRKGAKGEEGLILNGKETQLAILAPAGSDKEYLYHESHFHIVDPNGVKQDGDIVRYGEEFVLVDRNNMTWNHNAGGLTNYLGFRNVGLPGELCMKFRQRLADAPSLTSSLSSSSSLSSLSTSSLPVKAEPKSPSSALGLAASPASSASSPAGQFSKYNGEGMSPGSFIGSPKNRRIINTGSPPVMFYKDSVELVVTRSARVNKKIGNPISNFKRSSSR